MIIFDNMREIADGLGVLMFIFFVTAILSLPLGLMVSLAAIKSKQKQNLFYKIIRWIIDIYIFGMRSTPLLLQIVFWYYAMPLIIKVHIQDYLAVAIAFVLNYAAYFAETFRGGILSVDKGQYEASKALGMTYWQTMFRIIVPQMIRTVIPAISNEILALVRDTSLAAIIGMLEIMKLSWNIVIRTGTPTAFFAVSVYYVAFSIILMLVFRALEKKFALKD